MGNFGREPYAEQMCELILHLCQQFRRCCLMIFLFLALVAICLVEQNCFGLYEEHLGDTVLNLGQRFRRYHVKIFLFLALVVILLGVVGLFRQFW